MTVDKTGKFDPGRAEKVPSIGVTLPAVTVNTSNVNLSAYKRRNVNLSCHGGYLRQPKNEER